MDTTALLLLGCVAAVAGVSVALGMRERVALRIGLRNVRRGHWRTVLLVLGLLVGTTIVSSSLVIGDTVNSLTVHFTYQAYGFTDEAVYNQSPDGSYTFFNASLAYRLGSALAGTAGVAGVTPEIVGKAEAFDRTSGVPQTNLNLIGVDPNASAALGAFRFTNGTPVSGPEPGGVLLDAQAARDLDASPGDLVLLYGNRVVAAAVQGIVQDDTRGGFLFGESLFVNLSTAQTLENVSGAVNFVAITNAGSLSGGVALSDTVTRAVNSALATLGAPPGLATHELLKENLDQAKQAGNSFTTLFLVLGLFSIVAGGMLIVGIFVMLAEERKGEMGMLRAVGMRRRQLVLVYYFEGLAYSAGSAAAGTALGVGVGYGLVYAFSVFFASSSVTGQAILGSFTVGPDSLGIAYIVGFLLTLATILVTSVRASRLNIVRAIRSIPEPAPSLRAYTRLAYLGLLLVAVGGYLFWTTRLGTTDESGPILGLALVIGGAGLLASRFVRNRYAFSATGAGLLLWAGSVDLHRWLLGGSHAGTIMVFFVEGILMVLGAVTLYIFNADLIVAATSRLAGRNAARVPVVRIGLSYPSRRPFRTAINLTIFALVLFTVVGVASFGSSIQANLDNLVRSESGGYTFFAASDRPIPDLPAAVANNSTLAPEFSHVVPLIAGGALLGLPPGRWNGPYPSAVFAEPAGLPPSSSFHRTNEFNFSSLAPGYTAASAWAALAGNASVAVVDHSFAPGGFAAAFGPAHPTLASGEPVQVLNPTTNGSVSLTVVGVLSEDFIGGVWISPAAAAELGYSNETAFFLTVAPGVSAVHAAQQIKIAFFPYGLITFDFAEILQSSIQSTEAIIGLLEIFVALGLAVGIAAIGIVALRAVAERRSEIGMLRATGMTRGAVLKVFLLEYSYVALLGIGIGAVLGVLLDYDASHGSSGLLVFSVPIVNIAFVLAVAYLLTLAAVSGPSYKASRLAPAEALRYSE